MTQQTLPHQKPGSPTILAHHLKGTHITLVFVIDRIEHVTNSETRNFTAYQNRFHMAGESSGGVGNFWYSFDYGQSDLFP